MISFQENVAAEVAVRVAGDNAVVSKHLAGISRNKAAPELTTYEWMTHENEKSTIHQFSGVDFFYLKVDSQIFCYREQANLIFKHQLFWQLDQNSKFRLIDSPQSCTLTPFF